MQRYVVIPRAFAESHFLEVSSKYPQVKFNYAITNGGQYVVAEQTVIDFEDLIIQEYGSNYQNKLTYVMLSWSDFPNTFVP